MTRIETRTRTRTVTATVTSTAIVTDTKTIAMTVTWTPEAPYAQPTPIDGFFEGPDDVGRKGAVKAGPALVKPNENKVEAWEDKTPQEHKASPKEEAAPKLAEE